MAAPGKQIALLPGFFPLGFLDRLVGFFEGVIRVLLEGKKKFWQRLPRGRVDEHNDDRADQDASDVEQRPETFPAAPLGVIKNRLCHALETKNILAGGCRRVKPM